MLIYLSRRLKTSLVMLFLVSVLCSCSNFWTGFGSYEKPAKTSNKYYQKKFQFKESKLKFGRRYSDLTNRGLYANNSNEYSYFVFFQNGFVLHNSDIDSSNSKNLTLKYSEITYQDVGSYKLEGDTIFWGTRAGYMKRNNTRYYSAVLMDKGFKIINAPDTGKIKTLTLQ